MPPEIAVIVPTYNRQEFLGSTIMSVLGQTVQNLELIVVDDASTDDSTVIVEELRKLDPRVRLFVHQKNMGTSAARNTGVQNAKSKYVTFLDSDDLFAPERCESILSRLESKREPCVVYTDWISIDSTLTKTISGTSSAKHRPEGMIFPEILAGSFRFMCAPITCLRHCFDSVGLFDVSLRFSQDLDMDLRLSRKFPFAFDRLSTYGWRSHGGSQLTKSAAQLKREEARVLKRHLLDNLRSLDRASKKKAFDRLFGCLLYGGQWRTLFNTSVVDPNAFVSMMTIPLRKGKVT